MTRNRVSRRNTGITLDAAVLDTGQARARAIGVSFSTYVEGLIRKDNERALLNREIVTTQRRLQQLTELLDAINDDARQFERPIVGRSQ